MNDLEILRNKISGYPIICENLPYLPGHKPYDAPVSSKLISEFIHASETGLLLDLSHARIACHYMRMDYKAYIADLPTDRLRELHVTGIKKYGGALSDHFELQGDDWDAARWVAECIHHGRWRTPEFVSFEYGGVGDIFNWRCSASVLREQVPVLQEIFIQK